MFWKGKHWKYSSFKSDQHTKSKWWLRKMTNWLRSDRGEPDIVYSGAGKWKRRADHATLVTFSSSTNTEGELFPFHGIYIHVWSGKYVYWLSMNRFSRFFGLQQVSASANVTCIKGVVSLKGRVWRFLSIALVKVVMDYSSVPVCQGGAPMYGRGQFLTVTVNPSSSLELSQELGYTVLL